MVLQMIMRGKYRMKGDPLDWDRPSRRSRNQPAILGFCWLLRAFVFCICVCVCIVFVSHQYLYFNQTGIVHQLISQHLAVSDFGWLFMAKLFLRGPEFELCSCLKSLPTIGPSSEFWPILGKKMKTLFSHSRFWWFISGLQVSSWQGSCCSA